MRAPLDGVNSRLPATATELDELFARSPAGDLPVGYGRGTALVGVGPVRVVVAAAVRLVGWRGKVFAPDGTRLRNVISPLGVLAITADVRHEPSWSDGKACVVLDYRRTSLVARWVRDEIREIAPGRYLGQVYLRRRRLPLRFALDFRLR
jgi:hypothetical protein